ncbi:MAG: hypothetical protein IIA72_18005 [Proteobacteria bacterium]|nr:hypothetical protein [Pseudomonadota bacterium]
MNSRPITDGKGVCVDALWDTIGQTLDTFTPQERQNYFVAAGYEPESIESALEACLGSAAHLKSIPIIAANASTPPQRLAREWKPNSSGRRHSDP